MAHMAGEYTPLVSLYSMIPHLKTELELLVRQDSVIIIVNLIYPLLYFIKTKSVSDQLCSSLGLLASSK